MTALALLPPASVALIDRAKTNAAKIATIVAVGPLQTPQDEADAGALARAIQTIRSELEAARKQDKAPHLEAGRQVDAAFKEPLSELDRVDGLIRSRLAEAALARETARARAVETARAKAVAGDAAGANEALASVPVETKIEGVSERFSWELDSVDLRQVPPEYLMIDLTRVKAYVKDCVRTGAVPNVPGLTFKRATDVTIRRL